MALSFPNRRYVLELFRFANIPTSPKVWYVVQNVYCPFLQTKTVCLFGFTCTFQTHRHDGSSNTKKTRRFTFIQTEYKHKFKCTVDSCESATHQVQKMSFTSADADTQCMHRMSLCNEQATCLFGSSGGCCSYHGVAQSG